MRVVMVTTEDAIHPLSSVKAVELIAHNKLTLFQLALGLTAFETSTGIEIIDLIGVTDMGLVCAAHLASDGITVRLGILWVTLAEFLGSVPKGSTADFLAHAKEKVH